MKNIRNVLESNLKRGNTYIKQYDEIENILKKLRLLIIRKTAHMKNY